MSEQWLIFKGNRTVTSGAIDCLPDPPRWRDFRRDQAVSSTKKERRGKTFFAREQEIEMVNAALYLRRPLLVTGKPGTGKTSLAYAVAYELDLGEVLNWSITTRTTLKDGLYSYDAVGRLQDAQLKKGEDDLGRIGKYLRLGPLGTALLPADKPRVLLIDEIDKSDIDLPNDLLHVLEDGEFTIPELERVANEEDNTNRKIFVQTAFRDKKEQATYKKYVEIEDGSVRCTRFPLIILTSNGERDFPPAFLRRCLRLDMGEPTPERLKEIISAQLGEELAEQSQQLIEQFSQAREKGDLATDQLLNAVYLLEGAGAPYTLRDKLLEFLNN